MDILQFRRKILFKKVQKNKITIFIKKEEILKQDLFFISEKNHWLTFSLSMWKKYKKVQLYSFFKTETFLKHN